MPIVPRANNSQILSGAPLIMPPRHRENKSSQMVLTSIQLPKMATVGRAQSHLIGSSLQMSKIVINPGGTSRTQTYLISKQVVKIVPSENLHPHPMKHGTPFQKAKPIVPVVNPSQQNLTRFGTTRSSLANGVALQACTTTSEYHKLPRTIHAQASNRVPTTAASQTFYGTFPRRVVSHGSRTSLRALPPSVATDPRHRSYPSQLETLPKPARTSQLAGVSLQMSAAASQVGKASSMVLTNKHTPKAIGPVPCQMVGVSARQIPVNPLVSSRLILPSQMVGSSLHMRTAAPPYLHQKSRISTQLLTTSNRPINQNGTGSGRPILMVT